jgi:peptidoglycan/LPS O-acetylase OafA/YrhL
METKSNRLSALEGLRGIAAVVVVIFHALLIFYPSFFYGPDGYRPIHNIRFEDNVFGTPLTVLVSGAFAVLIFFVLSGFVLSIVFFQTGDEAIVKKLAAKRYLRLMLPALASILLTWAIVSFGLDTFKHQAETITQSGWLIPIWDIVPSITDAITQGVWGAFFNSSVNYNPVLWTIYYELIGSFLVFGIALLFGKYRHRWIVYLLLIVGFHQTYYLGFILGMVLADLYANGKFPFERNLHQVLSASLLVIGLFIAGFPSPTNYLGTTIYAALRLPWLNDLQNHILFLTIGAAMVIVATLTLRPLKTVLETKFFSTLGKYTYSLYLVHMAVLFTVCAGLFVWLYPMIGFNKSAVISIIVSLPVIMGVACLFEKYIDAPSIRLSGIFANWFLGLPQKEGPTAYSDNAQQPFYKRIIKYVRRFVFGRGRA